MCKHIRTGNTDNLKLRLKLATSGPESYIKVYQNVLQQVVICIMTHY